MPKPAKRPTIKDVAAEAGVGLMTVSYAFNRPDRVADATRQRVLETAERLGYNRPDSTARALRSGKTSQIGVVFGEHLSYAFDDPQAAQFMAGVAEVCTEERLGMVIAPTTGAPDDADRVLASAVDGYVLWTTTDDDAVLDAVRRAGKPAVIQGGPGVDGISCVAADDRAAAKALVREIVRPGDFPVIVSLPLDRRRESGVFTGVSLPAPAAFPVTRKRLEGYREGLAELGFECSSVPVVVVERNQRECGRTAFEAVAGSIPKAGRAVVLAMTDELALGVTDAGVPQGATVTGWDASDAALAAGVVTVTNPLREQGRLCARMAIDGTEESLEVPWSIVRPE